MFNKKAEEKKVVMANGELGYKDRDDVALFMLMLDFKPRNSYYNTVEDKLRNMEQLIDKLPILDVMSIGWYIGKKMGVRLSPTIALTRVANIVEQGELRQKLKFAMKEVFTRPDFISNSFGYMKYSYNTEMKEVKPWIKKTYKQIFESYSDITLKKRRMDRKEIKLKDLVKLLRPNPTKARIENRGLYKAIIEGTEDCKLAVAKDKVTGEVVATESIVRVLSDTSMSSTKKKEVIDSSLSSMAINEIIRNIANIEPTKENIKIVIAKLEDILSREDALRFLNPFDLIIHSSTINPKWTIAFDDILTGFVKSRVSDLERTGVLFDVSGSMYNGGSTDSRYNKALRFLSLLRPVLSDDLPLWFFSNEEWQDDEATKIWKRCKTPNHLFNAMSEYLTSIKRISMGGKYWRGTYLTRTIKKLVPNLDIDNAIILTDEYTYDNDSMSHRVREACSGKRAIVYNVDYNTTSAFSISSGIMKITGFDGKVIDMLDIYSNFDTFKNKIRTEFLAKYGA